MAIGVLYKQSVIWRRISDEEICVYICMERLTDGMCCVQSVEFFQKGTPAGDWSRLAENTGSLFLDDDLDNRCSWFADIQTAIREHDRAFGNER